MYLADRGPTAATAPTDADQGRTDRAAQPGRALRAIPATVLALGTVSLITDVSSEMVTAVLPLYVVAGLGLSPLGFGVLDGVYNGVSGLVRLFGGHLADRGRRHKAVAVVGYGLSALCKPLLLFVHTLPLISGVLALDRTGKGIRTAPRDAMISLASTPENRGRAFGVHRAMDTGGALLGPIVAFLVLGMAADGYDAVFTVSFCIAALGVLVLVLFVPGGRAPAVTANPAVTDGTDGASGGDDAAAASPPVTLRSAMALLRIPDVRRLTVTATLLGLTTVSDAFVYLMVQHRLGISERLFPLLPLGTAFFFLVLAMPLGVLADRVGRRRVFLGGHLALLLAYGLLLTPLHNDALAFVVLALHGTFYAATDGVLPAAAAGAVPAELRASGLALIGTGQALARFCCSIAFGAAWTVIGDQAVLGIAMAGLAVCAGWAAYALRGPETA
ncbi:MFS transporter [Planotetraspora mira]|uniref:MFS transporter n=1 Tax=Planotetraspora mira TaxID=58121 RepID=A0A8J3TLZ2_9ACTN|nr:MFS transporter [Planotetraspora mira]GII28231.1 MFS transporter [Planotetraspora mira]